MHVIVTRTEKANNAWNGASVLHLHCNSERKNFARNMVKTQTLVEKKGLQYGKIWQKHDALLKVLFLFKLSNCRFQTFKLSFILQPISSYEEQLYIHVHSEESFSEWEGTKTPEA